MDQRGTTPCRYTYDNLNQLTSEQGPSSHEYAYDSLYNRLAKDGTAHAVNALNQLLSDSETTYTYDLNGNRLSDGEMSYAYDALDRLVSVTKGTMRCDYTYDSYNRRLSKTVFEKEKQIDATDYLHIGQNEVGAYQNGKCTELRVLGIGKGAEIGAAVALELNGKTYAPLHDHIGNVVSLVDASTGDVLESYDYTSFGELLFTPTQNYWLFASKRYEPETGLIYFGRRY